MPLHPLNQYRGTSILSPKASVHTTQQSESIRSLNFAGVSILILETGEEQVLAKVRFTYYVYILSNLRIVSRVTHLSHLAFHRVGNIRIVRRVSTRVTLF